MFRESLRTQHRSEMIEITDRVESLVRQSGVVSGLAIVHVPHTTAAITINENADPDVKHDLLAKLAELIPHRESFYKHGEGNSDSHLKTSLTGNSGDGVGGGRQPGPGAVAGDPVLRILRSATPGVYRQDRGVRGLKEL